MRVDAFEKAELGLLAVFARAAAGEVDADDGLFGGRCVKADFDITPFVIKLGISKAHHHVTGRMAGVHRHARIALLLRKMEIAGQARQGIEFAFDVRGLRLDFLHTNTIGALFCEPGFEPFAGGGTDTVEIEAG